MQAPQRRLRCQRGANQLPSMWHSAIAERYGTERQSQRPIPRLAAAALPLLPGIATATWYCNCYLALQLLPGTAAVRSFSSSDLRTHAPPVRTSHPVPCARTATRSTPQHRQQLLQHGAHTHASALPRPQPRPVSSKLSSTQPAVPQPSLLSQPNPVSPRPVSSTQPSVLHPA